MEFDNTRNFLWTYSQAGYLNVYNITENTMEKIGSTSSIFNQANSTFGTMAADFSNHNIISIGCISLSESSNYVLIAVTNHAARIYFTLKNGDLKVGFVRLGPPVLESTGQTTYDPKFIVSTGLSSVTTAHVSSNLTLMANTKSYENKAQSTLIALTSEPFSDSFTSTSNAIVPKSTPLIIENIQQVGFGKLSRDGKDDILIDRIDEIRPLPFEFVMSPLAECLFSKKSDRPLAGLSDLAFQHAMPPTRYLVLTANALCVIVKARPIDELMSIIMESDEKFIKTFISRYTEVEALSMFLLLACENMLTASMFPSILRMKNRFDKDQSQAIVPAVTPMKRSAAQASNVFPFSSPNGHAGSPSTSIASSQVASRAARYFFESTSLPNFSAVLTHKEGCSQKLQALWRVFERLVRPFWEWSITITTKTEPSYQYSRFSSSQLESMLSPLRGLLQFITDSSFRNRFESTWPKNVSNTVKAYLETERIYLQDYILLVSRTVEALSMIANIVKYNQGQPPLKDLIARLSPPARTSLKDLEFRRLVSRDDGESILSLSKELIDLTLLDLNGNVKSDLIQPFNSMFPFYFGYSDMLLTQSYASMKLLDAQEIFGKRDIRKNYMEDAYKLLSEVCTLPSFPVADVALKCWPVHCYVPLIRICDKRIEAQQSVLSNGNNSSSDNQIIPVVLDTLSILLFGSPQEGFNNSAVASSFRPASNSLVFTEEEKKQTFSDCLNILVNSKSRELKWNLFAWLLACKKKEILFKLQNSEVVQFLMSNSSTARELAEYFVANQRYGEASGQYLKLSKNPQITLNEKISYLAEAKLCSESSNVRLVEKKDLDRFINDAEVQQRILFHVKSLDPTPNRVALCNKLEYSSCSFEDLFEICKSQELYNFVLELISQCENPEEFQAAIPIYWSNLLTNIVRNNQTQWPTFVVDSIRQLQHLTSNNIMFPLSSIALKLEKLNLEYRRDTDVSYVPKLLLSVGIPIHEIAGVYYQQIQNLITAEQNWRFHVLSVSSVICDLCLTNSTPYSNEVLSEMVNVSRHELQNLPESIEKENLEEKFSSYNQSVRTISYQG